MPNVPKYYQYHNLPSNSQLTDVESVIPYPSPVCLGLRYNLLSDEQIINNGNTTTKFEFMSDD